MAKMTGARVERWQTGAEKALKEVRAILSDLGDAKINTAGSIHSDVIDAAGMLVICEANLSAIADAMPARSPIARLRFKVAQASLARKAAAEQREAEKAAAG